MKVRIVTTSGSVLYGSLIGDEMKAMPKKEALNWIMNNDNKFIQFLQPNGQEILMNKSAIVNIAEDA
jgi:hypothetical protein